MKAITFVCCLFVVHSVTAQDITVKGKITDAKTGKGVKASILYKSYPTGASLVVSATAHLRLLFLAHPNITSQQRRKGIIPAPHWSTRRMSMPITPSPATGVDEEGETIELDHLIFEQGKG